MAPSGSGIPGGWKSQEEPWTSHAASGPIIVQATLHWGHLLVPSFLLHRELYGGKVLAVFFRKVFLQLL